MKIFINIILIAVTCLLVTQFNIIKGATADSFTFTAAGDYGNDRGTSSNLTKLIEGIGKQQPDFHIGLGDYIYNNSISEVKPWCDHFKQHINIGANKAINDPYGLNFPVQLISGNHDTGESNADIITITDSIRNCLPNRMSNIVESPLAKKGSPSSSYAIEYYFDFPTINPVARIILASPDLFGWSYAKGTSNYNFVKESILDARSKNIPWIIAGKHKNCITNGTKSCEYSQDLMNLFAGKDLGPNGTYGTPIDLVLEGHEHSYHRSKQLRTNSTNCTSILINGYNANCVSNQATTNYNKGDGKILSIIGTGGIALRSISGTSDSETGYFTSWMGTNQAYTAGVSIGGTNSWGFTKFTVTRTQLSAQFISTTGTYTDSFTISSNLTVPTPTPQITPTPIATIILTPTPTPTKIPTPTPSPSVIITPTVTPSSIPTTPISNCNNITIGGKMSTTVTIPGTGNYKIWIRAKSTTVSPNIWVKTTNYCNKLTTTSLSNSNWTWIAASSLYSLPQGNTVLDIFTDTSNVKVDDVLVTNDVTCIPNSVTSSCTSNMDYDGNSIVDIRDVILLVQKIFDNTVVLSPNSNPDLNNDGKINLVDVITFLQAFLS